MEDDGYVGSQGPLDCKKYSQYCNDDGQPKSPEELAKMRKLKRSKPPVFYSFDGGWNDPKYATWNLLRMGSPCAACHVTHWIGTIPTNSEIDPSLVSYYRSLDKQSHQVHWAALIFVGTSTALARETAVIGHYNQNPNYVQVANRTGANYFQVESGLSAEQVAAQNEKFIVNGVQGGCRFVQCSFPVRPNSGLEHEIGWLAENGYSSGGDMFTEVATSLFRTASGLLGLAGDE